MLLETLQLGRIGFSAHLRVDDEVQQGRFQDREAKGVALRCLMVVRVGFKGVQCGQIPFRVCKPACFAVDVTKNRSVSFIVINGSNAEM